MKSIYIFSGLGADERVFKDLAFVSDYYIIFIRWILPFESEPVEKYAKRLTEQITTVRPIFIGLSFRGIIAIEVAKHIEIQKIILIASAKTRQEIPGYYRLAGHLKLHKILPLNFLKNPNFLTHWLFGTTNKEERKILSDILHDTDVRFLKWAIDKIVTWTNLALPVNLKHIHGTSDRILPIRFVHCDFKVLGGGHFMTITRSQELSHKLKTLLLDN